MEHGRRRSLARVADSGLPVLRFYQWEQPTLSLGYFQKFADRTGHPPSRHTDVVRRLSGGGAILHDQELTYSLILPASHSLSRNSQQLYNLVHQALVQLLNQKLSENGSPWQTQLCSSGTTLASPQGPWLCFQRRAAGDILLGKPNDNNTPAIKVVGSAQRRRHGNLLQHGSLLLCSSLAAPELESLESATGLNYSVHELLANLPQQLAKALSFSLADAFLNEQQHARVKALKASKYECSDWTQRR